jgi:hypothetical protein
MVGVGATLRRADEAGPVLLAVELDDRSDVDMVGHAGACARGARRLGAGVNQGMIVDGHRITPSAAGVTAGIVALYRTDGR